MNGGDVNRIWQPNVRPTADCCPYPGQQQQEGRLYTKTSLHHHHHHLTSSNQDDDDDEIGRQRVAALNREILRASESFNSSPKPFTKQTTLPENFYSQTISSSPKSACRLASSTNSRSFSHEPSQVLTEATPLKASQQEDSMAPKLVHNLYNSPIDLYSMNNIRRTIEAHSEIIAPGVKGINFSKLDTPVNKQSEVYKLVMEEERQQGPSSSSLSSSRASRLSPISGQPTIGLQYAREQHATGGQPDEQASSSNDWQQHQLIINNNNNNIGKPAASQAASSQRPKCCECGQFIVGPFARLQNRHIHPHCFNCTTCGTSLKNSGYFTINDKLYCDIHAKQVANLMRLNYNFDANSQTSGASRHQETNFNYHQNANQTDQQQQLVREGRQHDLSQATISTMFSGSRGQANRVQTSVAPQADHHSGGGGDSRQQVHWTWRPAGDQVAELPSSSATMRKVTSNERQLTSSTSSISVSHQNAHNMAHSRLPVCTNCQQQIHGPYILAGESTWCKACSSANFTCSACHRSLLKVGFIELAPGRYHCELCFDAYSAPICSKCNSKIKADCLNALGRQWHPTCFVCQHCRQPFGNSSFYLEDNKPYCQRDWNLLFTSKCYSCSYPIEAGDKWIEALERNYHSNCFSCSSCQAKLEGSTFYCKAGKPYCRLHAR